MIHPNTEIHLYLIRHAQSHMNITPHLVGGRSTQTPLSQLGEDQATALNKFFRAHDVKFNQVHCSPLERAKSTAEISLGSADPIINIDDRLIEYSAGDWEGKNRSQIQTPEIKHQMAEMTVDFQPPDGESQRQVSLRVADWLQEIILNNQKLLSAGQKHYIATFSHGLAIKCLLHHILNFDSQYIWRLEIDNCSISKLIYNSHGWWPKYINRVP